MVKHDVQTVQHDVQTVQHDVQTCMSIWCPWPQCAWFCF